MASVLSMLLTYLVPMAQSMARNGTGAAASIFGSESLSMGLVSGPFFLVVAIVAGYLGGKLGGRLHPASGRGGGVATG